jgi:putative transposase
MLRTHQYRVDPTANQKHQLNSWLRHCLYWYNWQVGDRFQWWEQNRCEFVPHGISLSDHLHNVKLRNTLVAEAKKRAEGEKVKTPKKPRLFVDAVDAPSCPLTCSPLYGSLRDQPNRFTQQGILPHWKKDFVKIGHSGELLDFKSIPSQTLQDVTKRADKAFDRFLKGDKNGKKSGKPRFKTQRRYRTMVISGQAVTIQRIEKNWLFLSFPKFRGWLKVRLHRPLPDGFQLKSVLLTQKADGWYAALCLEDKTVPALTPDEIEPTWENSIGMDAVLHEEDYLATSENTKLPALKSYRKSEARLAKVQKRKDSKKKGSKSKRKLAKRVSKEHQRIARARKDHAYNTAHEVVKTNKKVIFVEDLNLQGLSKKNKAKKNEEGKYLPNGQSAKSGLNKSWSDAAFGQFFTTLEYIAEKAGAKVVKVKPAYTSQVLSYRDEIVFKDCSVREYWDETEQLLVDRDINAGVNIKRVGLGLFPTIKRRRGKKGNGEVTFSHSKTASTSKQVLVALQCQKPTLYL